MIENTMSQYRTELNMMESRSERKMAEILTVALQGARTSVEEVRILP